MDVVELEGAPGRRHPWEVARMRFFLRMLGRAGALGPGVSLLDVGSGDGWLARELLARGPAGRATCWDQAYTPALRGRFGLLDRPDLRYVADRPAERFDLLLLLDVLEHVEDDRGFLEEIVRENLAPGGAVLVSVPAWPLLYSAHDRRLRHHRRYAPGAARAVLEGAGLDVVTSGGVFHGLLAARALQLLRERLVPPAAAPAGVDGWHGSAALTAAVTAVLTAEGAVTSALSRVGVTLPGLSWWGLCRRRR